MANFMKLALECAARGWHSFPCRGKKPLTAHGHKDASKDEAKLREWAERWPDANAGIACGISGLAVLDIDDGLETVPQTVKWCNRNNIPVTYAVRTGRRPEVGLQIYFAGTMPEVTLFQLDGCSGQVKSLGGYVMAAGSVHPDSGELYEACYGDIEPAPLPEFIRALKNKPKPVLDANGEFQKIAVGQNRHADATSEAGRLRNSGLDKDQMVQALIPFSEARHEVPLSLEDIQHIAHNIAKKPIPEPECELVLGDDKPVTEDADALIATPRPVYPDWIWDGTAYGDFADLCTRDNNIPKKLFSESFRTVTGALMGGNLEGGKEGALPRAYTILIAPPGKGKGTACSRVMQFFDCMWEGGPHGDEAPLLFRGKSIYRKQGIGAWIVNPASAPGMMKALEPDKPSKGKPKTEQANESWDGVPRIITIQEEARGLFANFQLEATGAGLESCLCELFDRTSFSSTVTAQRKQAAGEAMFSLLGGITPDGWNNVFAKTASVESGFLSRLNIIATEGTFKSTAGLDPVSFVELRRSFLPRLLDLAGKPSYIRVAAAADKKMSDWFGRLDPSEEKAYLRTRINIHAWRVALHLAWLKKSEYMEVEHVEAGIAAAEYQIQMREWYAPTPGDSKQARCESSIRKVLQAVRRISLRELKQRTNANRVGLGMWDKSLKALAANGEVRIDQERPATVILLKTQD